MTREPCCEHNPVGRVSWPEKIRAGGCPHASTYVCDEPHCIEDAKRWVHEITGHEGIFIPLRGRGKSTK